MLPGGSGINLIKHLKRDEFTKKIPVVMLTARGEEEDKVRGLEVGADDDKKGPSRARLNLPLFEQILLRKVQLILASFGIVRA